jgi:hypothetical protein
LGKLLEKGRDQRGLTSASFTSHKHDLAFARQRATQPLVQQRQLSLTPNQASQSTVLVCQQERWRRRDRR